MKIALRSHASTVRVTGFATLFAAASVVLGASFSVYAQNQQAASGDSAYPARPVHIVVPGGAGTGPDTLTRILATELAKKWHQPVVVENVAGAGGNIGHARVAEASPDGYTLLVGMIGPMAINPNLHAEHPFDPLKDLTAISMIARYPNMLLVNPQLPYKTVDDLIAHARQNPKSIRYGSAGVGTTPHLSGVLLSRLANVDMLHVPYKSSAQMTTDAIAGHIDIMFLNPPAVLPHVKAGKLRAIAITSRERAPYAPDIPTLIEEGVPDYELTSWYGLFAPAGTPQEVVQKINRDLVDVIAMPEIKAKFDERGDEPFAGTVKDANTFVASELERWGKIIKEAGIQRE